MKIAVVAHGFPIGPRGGNVFVAKRMAELLKTDELFGVRPERRDLVDWKYRKLAVRLLGTTSGVRLAEAAFRLSHPTGPRTRSLFVNGRPSAIKVLSFRYAEDREVPEVSERSSERVARALRRRGCDIVHSHFLWYADAGARIAARLGVPHVITAHGSDVHGTMRDDEEARARYIKLLAEADAAIFVSRALLELAQSCGYTGTGATVIPNGYDPAVFSPSERRGGGAGARLLFVGSLLEVKGADRLPRIFALVKEALPDASLDIVGVGDDPAFEDDLRAAFAAGDLEPRFHGLLPAEEVARLMKGADLLIVPSRSEGFGCVALEAQACGTPVLGSDAGGLPEAIGIDGMVVRQDDDFEAAFARRAADILRSRDAPVRPDILRFSWSATVERERRVYATLLERGRSGDR